MARAKTDLTAAAARREYAARMPFVVWQPPAAEVLALRGIARRIAALVVEPTRDRNRLHAVRATAEPLAIVVNDIEVNIRHLEGRIALLTAEAVAVIGEHEELHRAFERLTAAPGIATHRSVPAAPRAPRAPRRHARGPVGRSRRPRSSCLPVRDVRRQARPHLEGG